jgi:hypothetical protein
LAVLTEELYLAREPNGELPTRRSSASSSGNYLVLCCHRPALVELTDVPASVKPP